MKAVILAGGFGTRLSEETGIKPKPLVEIGSKPIIWHIMKTYAHHGITEFIICAGYLGHTIKRYFADYFINNADTTFDLKSNTLTIHNNHAEDWKVTVVDTGLETMTGGRLARVRPYIGDETFCMTYGDGVSDIDITKLIAFHQSHGKLATLTAVRAPGRFGIITMDDAESDKINSFNEKTEGESSMINGGYFVLEPKVLDYIKEGDQTTWEQQPLKSLAEEGQLHAFRHYGFWQPMDTLRDKVTLDAMWNNQKAPWKVW